MSEELKGKSVEVRGPIDYGFSLALYMVSGATVWPWHKGFKPLDDEDDHHTYSWEDCGFLKQAGVLETIKGDFKTPIDMFNFYMDSRKDALTPKQQHADEMYEKLKEISRFAINCGNHQLSFDIENLLAKARGETK